MKAVVAAFNQEKALVGAFSVITNLRMELFEALAVIASEHTGYYHKITDDYLEDTNKNISSTWAAPVSTSTRQPLSRQPGSLGACAPYSY